MAAWEVASTASGWSAIRKLPTRSQQYQSNRNFHVGPLTLIQYKPTPRFQPVHFPFDKLLFSRLFLNPVNDEEGKRKLAGLYP
jgi:hypothetical protein